MSDQQDDNYEPTAEDEKQEAIDNEDENEDDDEDFHDDAMLDELDNLKEKKARTRGAAREAAPEEEESQVEVQPGEGEPRQDVSNQLKDLVKEVAREFFNVKESTKLFDNERAHRCVIPPSS